MGNIDFGHYGKFIAAVIAGGLTQFNAVDFNETGQILISPPTDVLDAVIKVAIVAGAVWYVKNKPKDEVKNDA